MGKSIHYLALFCALTATQASALTGDNPFEKTQHILAGAGSDWAIDGEVLRKSSGNEDGTYYHLEIGTESMRLVMTESADIGTAKSFKTLEISDLSIDGEQMPVFKWCLQNQEPARDHLAQGLSVKLGICQNRGEFGEFIVKVNHQTREALENGKRLNISLKPFRTEIQVNFDIERLSDAMAVMALKNKPAPVKAKAATVAAPSAPPPPRVVKQVVKMCEAIAPPGFKGIKAESYLCSDAADRMRAERKIAGAVRMEKERRAAAAKKQEQARLTALEARRKQEQEELRKQQELAEQQAAIEASQQKHSSVLNELTEKMLGVCNKMWSKGQHRCYCEKYIEHAPKGIESDPSCSS